MNSHEVFIHIHQGCFAGTGAIVRLPQCQWSKSDGYGKINQCITTTKHSKAVTVCIFLGINCTWCTQSPKPRLKKAPLLWHPADYNHAGLVDSEGPGKISSRRWRPGFCQGVWQSPSGPVDWSIPEWPHTGSDYRQQHFRPGPSSLWRPARNSAGTIIIFAIHQRPTISCGSRNRSTLLRGWLLNLLIHWDPTGSDTIPRRSGCTT